MKAAFQKLASIVALGLVSTALGHGQNPQPPALPKVDRGACPFECCQFGRWTARKRTPVYSTWKRDSRKRIFAIQAREVVNALTGVHVTYRPGRVRVGKMWRDGGLKPGDEILTYTYRGEGYFDFWAKGRLQSDQVHGLNCSEKGAKSEPFCTVDDGDKEWWIRIKTRNGRVGWVFGNENFDGTDACG